jgi:oligosaccharide repeat unit polymerase
MKRKIMQPAVLFSLLWAVILLTRFIFSFTILPELFPISISTYLVLFIGTLSFSLGSFFETLIWQKSGNLRIPNVLTDNQLNLTLRLVYLAIVTIGLPLFLMASYRLFLASDLDDFFIGLRTQLVYGDIDIGPTKYLVSLSFIVFGISLYSYFNQKNIINTFLLWLTSLVTITYSIFMTGRGFFLIMLSLFLGMSFLHNKKFSFRKVIRFLAVFFVLFIAFGIMYGKGGNEENTIVENMKQASQATAVYLVSAVNALDWDLHHQFQISYSGNNSLRLFRKIGDHFNLTQNAKIPDLVQPFVFVPYPTNVYTVYSPYIKDFGKWYAWFMVAVFGFIHSFVHNKAITTKNFRYSLYYSFLLFPLLISFFADFYLTIFSTWIQVIFFTELFIFLNDLWKYQCKRDFYLDKPVNQ